MPTLVHSVRCKYTRVLKMGLKRILIRKIRMALLHTTTSYLRGHVVRTVCRWEVCTEVEKNRNHLGLSPKDIQ